MERTRLNLTTENMVLIDTRTPRQKLNDDIAELYEKMNPYVDFHDTDIMAEIQETPLMEIMNEMETIMLRNAENETIVSMAYNIEMTALNEILTSITKILKRSRG